MVSQATNICLGASHLLVKAAYTGVAASLIGGKTTHTIAGLNGHNTNNGQPSQSAKAKLQRFWQTKAYLIIDEFSMISKSFLQRLSTNISIGKEGSDDRRNMTFGGISVVLCGDLHQFPPVTGSHLFRPINTTRDSDLCKSGHMVYQEFQTVVILKEQKRITDPIWHTMLTNLRKGKVEEADVQMLRKLIIGRPTSDQDQNDIAQWRYASLVTPRHGVRIAWNKCMARNWCRDTNQQLFVCHATDTIENKPLTIKERISYVDHMQKNAKRKKTVLPDEVELAIGMEVIVTNNIAVDLDITNGARGHITEIILDKREPPLGNEPIVHLVKMPLCIMVKFHSTRASTLAGLEEKVVPIEPMVTRTDVRMDIGGKKTKARPVIRHQFPITPAYAFTDYRSQGQTISRALVDLAKPPSGKLTHFSVYVALSRSAGRDTIRLLREFDETVIRNSFDAELALEDERLERLDQLGETAWAQSRSKWCTRSHRVPRSL
jgi:hypothetical protein